MLDNDSQTPDALPVRSGMGPDAAAAEVLHAWQLWRYAATRVGYAVPELVRPGAAEHEMAAAEGAVGRRFPADLAALYRISDGQADWHDHLAAPDSPVQQTAPRWVCPFFGDAWSFATLAQLTREWQSWDRVRREYPDLASGEELDASVRVRAGHPVRRLYSSPSWIPFAIDGEGNALASDLDPEPGGTPGQVIAIGPDEDERRVVATGIVALLTTCAERLHQAALREDDADGRLLPYRLEAHPITPTGSRWDGVPYRTP